MNRYAVQLISRGAINKMGNMLYDYGNSVWLASMGTIGQTVLGMYQISELVTSILVNPFGGVISDRFSRRKILMTADLVCGILCLAISFIRNDSWMIGALIVANIVQAIAFAFSRTANKAIIAEVVEKDEIVIYNSRLELVLQVVGISSPVLSFSGNLVCELFMTIFNIHFFTQVQTKVESEFIGRALSTIFTLAILFMPIAKGFMTVLQSVHLSSFLIIGSGVIILSCISFIYVRTHFEKLI